MHLWHPPPPGYGLGYLPMKGGGGIDSHGFFRLIHSTCIFAYHELSLRSMLILDQTVQKGDITKGGSI